MKAKENFTDFLDRMNTLLTDCERRGQIIVGIEDIKSVFPELKETEDEKIRKALIFYLGDMPEDTELRNGVTNRDVFAWLEKQKPVECTDEPQQEYSNDDKSAVFVESFERQQDIFKQQQDIFKQGKEELKNIRSFSFSLEDKIGSYNSQDSELIEETYYIPEGYEAEIHENKVTIKKKSDKEI